MFIDSWSLDGYLSILFSSSSLWYYGRKLYLKSHFPSSFHRADGIVNISHADGRVLSVLFSSSRMSRYLGIGKQTAFLSILFSSSSMKPCFSTNSFRLNFPSSFHRADIYNNYGRGSENTCLSILFSSSSVAFFTFLAIYLPVYRSCFAGGKLFEPIIKPWPTVGGRHRQVLHHPRDTLQQPRELMAKNQTPKPLNPPPPQT